MKKLTFTLLVLTLLLLAACASGPPDPADYKGTTLVTPIPAPDFGLINAEGDTVSLSDFEDKIVLLYFGYSFCPDVCPATLSELGQVQRELDDAGENIQVVMVTVDPLRDTPQQLAEYVSHFHPTFIGLSGEREAIDAAGEGYGVFYEIHEGTPASGYLVDHTARVFVVDPQGMYQLSFGFGTPVDDIVHDLRLMMRGMSGDRTKNSRVVR